MNSLTNLQGRRDQSFTTALEIATGTSLDGIPGCCPGQGGVRSANHGENYVKVADKKTKLITQITSTACRLGVTGLLLHDSGVHSHESLCRACSYLGIHSHLAEW